MLNGMAQLPYIYPYSLSVAIYIYYNLKHLARQMFSSSRYSVSEISTKISMYQEIRVYQTFDYIGVKYFSCIGI